PREEVEIIDVEWADRRSIPMLKSVLLVERNGQLFDLRNSEPRLYDHFPNEWLLQSGVNYLDAQFARKDPDNDGFTTAEEFHFGTSPSDSLSTPPLIEKLRVVSVREQHYGVKCSSFPDANTVQLHSGRGVASMLRAGEESRDKQLVVQRITEEQVHLLYKKTGETVQLRKKETHQFVENFVELQVLNRPVIHVKLATHFLLQGERWVLAEVTESSVRLLRQSDGEERLLNRN
ncbi:MAG: Amuc_1099 family pilus-like system protein, partial [Verrucomicrobiota bacterium]